MDYSLLQASYGEDGLLNGLKAASVCRRVAYSWYILQNVIRVSNTKAGSLVAVDFEEGTALGQEGKAKTGFFWKQPRQLIV